MRLRGPHPVRAPLFRVGLVAVVPAALAGMLWAATQTGPVALPSGQQVRLQEVIEERSEGAQVARFRFIAPWIFGGGDAGFIEQDMEHLCNEVAARQVANLSALPAQIVISLSSEPTEFGVPAPEITQFFQAYSLVDGTCVWEPF